MKWAEELACLLLELVKSLGLRCCIVETYFRQTVGLNKAIRKDEHLCCEVRTLVCASQALAKMSAVLLLDVDSGRAYLAM
jgi:hypothetical protein